MLHLRNFVFTAFIVCLFFFITGCNSKKNPEPIFEVLHSATTGLNFNNKLTPTPEFNMFKYMYFYNGAGVGAGDFNNDNFIDLFFSSNQGQNKIFLNQGNNSGGKSGLKFKEVTAEAQIPNDGGWSTGVKIN